MSRESKQRGREKARRAMEAARQERRTQLLKELPEEKLKAAVDLINGDGHSVYPTRVLVDCGWTTELAELCSTEYVSSKDDPSGMMFDAHGNAIEKMNGWYTLWLLSTIVSVFDIEAPGCLGRGFQARAYDKAIREHFNWTSKKETEHVC